MTPTTWRRRATSGARKSRMPLGGLVEIAPGFAAASGRSLGEPDGEAGAFPMGRGIVPGPPRGRRRNGKAIHLARDRNAFPTDSPLQARVATDDSTEDVPTVGRLGRER